MANNTSDAFDLGVLALTPERLAELAPTQKQSHPRPRKRLPSAKPEAFVMLPYERTLAAAGRLGDAPLAVLIEIGYRAFKAHRKQVPLANATLQSVGITRYAKLRALRRLEADGMIAVDWRGGRRTPLVTLSWV